MSENPAISAFHNRHDLEVYGRNALLLYALELRLKIDDIHAVAADSLVDGSDDKGCDLIYVDSDGRIAIIAQAHMAEVQKDAAPSHKASILSGAASWLISGETKDLPERLRPGAMALRDALNAGEIDNVMFWYVHNMAESVNCDNELAQVKKTAESLIKTKYPATQLEISTTQVGLKTLEEWYNSTQAPIIVNERFEVSIPGGYSLETSKWISYTTAVPIVWLYDLYKTKKFGKRLFSANLRDFLGIGRHDSNINTGIKNSALETPEDFWVFNNGITAIVNDFKVDPTAKTLTIDGLSIVNGAQTTGSISDLNIPPDKNAVVQIRFIKCSKPGVILDIVRYNNSQNRLEAPDFKSNHPVQQRLRAEFEEKYPKLLYLGGRRGIDNYDSKRTLLSSDSVAQSLAAFHQKPGIAYHKKSEIWTSDVEYPKLFNENTHAEHIVFVYSLDKAIRGRKLILNQKEESGVPLSQSESDARKFLSQRGAILILNSAIGASMEIIFDKQIPDPFSIKFNKIKTLEEYEQMWLPVIEVFLPTMDKLSVPLDKPGGLRNIVEVQKALKEAKAMVEIVFKSVGKDKLATFISSVSTA